MMNATIAVRWLALVAIVVIGGCAPAYYSYSGCYVDCQYCAPPPLPYVHYDGCVCHSCAASKYLVLEPPTIDDPAPGADDSGSPN